MFLSPPQHKNKTVLCRVNSIHRKTSDTSRNTTCRSLLTSDQWHTFEKKLRTWLELDESNAWSASTATGEQLHEFVVKPHLEVKICRSKLTAKNFGKCFQNLESSEDFECEDCLPVLDCNLEYKQRAASKVRRSTIIKNFPGA